MVVRVGEGSDSMGVNKSLSYSYQFHKIEHSVRGIFYYHRHLQSNPKFSKKKKKKNTNTNTNINTIN